VLPPMNWHENTSELYDSALGPPRPHTRRPTAEWLDPYEAVDTRASIMQMGVMPPRPCFPRLWSIPQIAQMRRLGLTFRQIRELTGFSAPSLRFWLYRARYDDWGWRQEMTQKCRSCRRKFSPHAVRAASERASWSTWPSTACSKSCAARLGIPNPQG
jgi:hypothetical protein